MIIANVADSSLGMDRPISRRDFLDGVALSAIASCGPGRSAGPYPDEKGIHAAIFDEGASYPPAEQGLQGDTSDAMAVPHALRDRRFWPHAGTPTPTGERYDLVVVGAGISGIAAAYRWWRRDPRARVLVLDTHDDLGGRARRNEFPRAGRTPLVGCGGPPSLPATPSRETAELLADLGVASTPDGRTGRARYRELGMRDAVFCDRESFGADRLVVHRPGWIADLPLTHEGRTQLAHLFHNPPDCFPGLSEAEKRARLAGLSYTAFLREVCRAGPEVIRFCRTMPVHERSVTSDLIGALDAWSLSGPYAFPGFAGLGRPQHAPQPAGGGAVLFPDGDHGLVRLMIRRMIPGVAPGGSAADVTLARFDYDRLDHPANPVRVRLSSPVVLVRNDGPADAAPSATVGYHDGEAVRLVRAGAVLLACWHGVIPHLVPDLPPEHRAAFARTLRAPVLYATAHLRDWRGWHAAGVDRVRCTGAYWSEVRLAPAVDAGTYRAPADPAEPILAHLVRPAVRPGPDPRTAVIAGRRELAAVPYRHLEFTVREQLARLLGPHGFDPARDVLGLTVNRWAHGVPLAHPGAQRTSPPSPTLFGRIAVAGSDAAPEGGPDAAITAAFRAVDALRAGSAVTTV